jgi:3D (Asp-Asp-Asp) domain-containing protein
MGHDDTRHDIQRRWYRVAVRLGRTAVLVAIIAVVFSDRTTRPAATGLGRGQPRRFTATAYCDRGITQAGVRARSGVAAADPSVLPVGSVIRVDPDGPDHAGIYTVMDTGGKVVGRRIDLFVSDCGEARRFGLQRAEIRVLRLGWDPRASVAGPALLAAAGQPGMAPASTAGNTDDLSDGAITARVKARLALDDTIRARNIHVDTKDAVVTLSGVVGSDAERQRAVDITGKTEGVKSVVDHLEVKQGAPPVSSSSSHRNPES